MGAEEFEGLEMSLADKSGHLVYETTNKEEMRCAEDKNQCS